MTRNEAIYNTINQISHDNSLNEFNLGDTVKKGVAGLIIGGSLGAGTGAAIPTTDHWSHYIPGVASIDRAKQRTDNAIFGGSVGSAFGTAAGAAAGVFSGGKRRRQSPPSS